VVLLGHDGEPFDGVPYQCEEDLFGSVWMSDQRLVHTKNPTLSAEMRLAIVSDKGKKKKRHRERERLGGPTGAEAIINGSSLPASMP